MNQHRVSRSALLNAKMREMAANIWQVPYISLYQEICDTGSCAEYADAP